MAMLAERERLEKERHLHELQLQQRQLTYLLERCNAYATQATLVTGFAFTAFSAEALKDLDYVHAPFFSFTFVLSGAVTMTLSIGAVLSSSYLMQESERLSMESNVKKAVSLVRWRMSWVFVPYMLALIFLWATAALLVFATCRIGDEDEQALCYLNGGFVVAVFVTLGPFIVLYPRYLIAKDVRKAYAQGPNDFSALDTGMRLPLREGGQSGGDGSAPPS